MALVGIVYFSGSGTTTVVAKAVQEGVEQAGAQVLMVELQGTDIVEGRWQNEAVAESLDQCDAIIFGTPTYMGSVSAQLKSFFDAMAPRWYTQVWNGKYTAAFTASSLASGDKLNALQDILSFAMQMGMIWVGTGANFQQKLNPGGFYLGAGVTASTAHEVSAVDADTARYLGRRVTEFLSGSASG